MTVDVAPAPAAAPEAKTPEALPTGSNAPTGQETPKTPPEAPPKPEFFEVKVNGKTVRMTREDLIKKATLADGALEKFEQAAAKERQMNAILSRAKSNPVGALMDAGLTKDEAREAFENWYSSEFIEPEALTAEQRELKKAQDELKRYKALEKEYQEKTRAHQEEEEVKTHRESLQKQIIDAMDEHKLPRSKFAVSRVAFYMKQARDKGFEAPMDLIMEQVKEERKYMFQDVPEDANYTDLIHIYGEDVVKRIISEHLKHIRDQRGKAAIVAQTDIKKDSGKGKLTMREAEENLKRLMGRA